jgi:predicted nucleotidyltransferase
MISEELRAKIVHSLQTLNPYKIILFGSYAYGTPKKDSDIDIVFVHSDDGYKTFEERIALKIEILKKLDAISQPIDILAYTKKEWEELVTKNSSFIREINQKGVVLESAA